MGDAIGGIVGAVLGVAGAAAFGPAGGFLGTTFAATAGGAGLGITAGTTLYDAPRAAERASEASQAQYFEQQKVQAAQQRLSEAQNIRGRLAQVRGARQQRASNLVRAINVGGAEGTQMSSFSPAMGQISSTQSQVGGNIGYIDAIESMGKDIFGFNQAASGYRIQEVEAIMSDLIMAKTVGGLGSTIFSMSGGFGELFSKSPDVPAGSSSSSSPSSSDLMGSVSFYTGNSGY
jgi:hypothetical protein